MRTIRALTIAAAVVVALPTIASAQHGRQFKDAWFWGIKAGGLTFADSSQAYKQAPLAGVEWLIVEQDEVDGPPFEAVERSLQAVRRVLPVPT